MQRNHVLEKKDGDRKEGQREGGSKGVRREGGREKERREEGRTLCMHIHKVLKVTHPSHYF